MKRLALLIIKTALWLIASQTFAQPATDPSEIIYDTVATLKTRLSVTNNGYMGQAGAGGVNLDYTAIGDDCDSTATVYLRDGGPFIVQSLGDGQYRMSASMHQNGSLESPLAFRPISGWSSPAHLSAPNYDGHFSGTFVNWDSSIACEVTTFAPTSGYDSSNFMIRRYDFFPADSNTHSGLTFGTAIDWDIPSDPESINTTHILGAYEAVYVQGTDTGIVSSCQPNTVRLATIGFFGMHTAADTADDICASECEPYGAFTARTDNLVAVSSQPDSLAKWFWYQTGVLSGVNAEPNDSTDLFGALTFVHDYTLWAGEKLTVYTALTTVMDGDHHDLEDNLDAAFQWYNDNLRPWCADLCGCCKGYTGNVDNDVDNIVDIGDLTKLIDYLFISFTPLVCMEEANVDGVGIVDIGDLTFMIRCFTSIFWCWYAPC